MIHKLNDGIRGDAKFKLDIYKDKDRLSLLFLFKSMRKFGFLEF